MVEVKLVMINWLVGAFPVSLSVKFLFNRPKKEDMTFCVNKKMCLPKQSIVGLGVVAKMSYPDVAHFKS